MKARLFVFNAAAILFLLLVYGLLQWLCIEAGRLVDWIIGVGIAEWLMIIVTVPWDVHFRARGVLIDAAQSKEKQIDVDQKDVSYVERAVRLSLLVALSLHVVSAGVFFILAQRELIPLGYVSAAAALLLTLLRPSLRAYTYLQERMENIRQKLLYPREDIVELRNRVSSLEYGLEELKTLLNEHESTSWRSNTNSSLDNLTGLTKSLQKTLKILDENNKNEHEKMMRDTKTAINEIGADSRFREHFQDVVRAIKDA